jgi:hypothetical protein
VLSRWQGGFAAVVITLATIGLVALDLADGGFQRWWASHALTTDTVAGLLVVLVTVLVVDQVVSSRQVNDRARAVAAQSGIMVNQAARSVKAVNGAPDSSGDRGAASDEVRTYMMMLLVSAPVLIEAKVSRTFLEEAQRLGGEMAHALTTMTRTPDAPARSIARLDDAVKRLRAASTPLLQLLTPEELLAAAGEAESR